MKRGKTIDSQESLGKQCYQLHNQLDALFTKLQPHLKNDEKTILKAASHILGVQGIFGVKQKKAS